MPSKLRAFHCNHLLFPPKSFHSACLARPTPLHPSGLTKTYSGLTEGSYFQTTQSLAHSQLKKLRGYKIGGEILSQKASRGVATKRCDASSGNPEELRRWVGG